MYLIVNNTELVVNNAYAERDVNTNTLTAVIEVPYSVDFVTLKTLFMEHTGIITKVNDDGSTESWDGFAYNKPPVDDGEQYRIVLVGNENTYQIERLRHLEQILAEKESKISEQEEEITQLRQSLEVKTAELVSKEEEALTLAEQCADLLYMSSLKEIETIESEVLEQ